MKGVLVDLEALNHLVSAINTKLLPSHKYQLRELPSAIYDVFYKEIDRIKKEFHELIYGPKSYFRDEYGLIHTICPNCFRGRTDLKAVYFSECVSIYRYAFEGCINLSEIFFPKASFIEGGAFKSCYALTKVSNLPSGSVHLANIFCDCKNLSYASLNWSYIPIGTFSGCVSLISVNISNATKISGYAFENCSSLSQIILDRVETIKGYAFANCISLEEVNLPSCQQIGWPLTYDDEMAFAFLNCINLRKVYAPVCSSIYRSTFINCYSLSEFYMPMLSVIPDSFLINGSGLISISSDAFSNTYIIAESAFKECQNLKSIVFRNVFDVHSDAFKGCSRLETVEFYGEYNSNYDEYISAMPRHLRSFNLGNNFVGLQSSVFADCALLANISFPNLSIINESTFANCTNLSYISFSLCAYVGKRAFCNCYNLEEAHLSNCKIFNKSAFYNCSKLKVIDAASCIIIGNGTFANCKSLEYVSFPEVYDYNDSWLQDVQQGTYIRSIFYNCTSLKSVYMPKFKLGSEQESLFENCINLENLVLSSKGNTIGANMFKNCYRLFAFDFTNIISIYNSAFENCSALTEVIAPDCTFLGPCAFKNCANLVHVQINAFNSMYGATNPTTELFANCYNLEEIVFGDGTYNVYGSSIFANCSKLNSIIDLTSGYISADAFFNCSSLSIVDCRLKRVTGNHAFANCVNLKEAHIAGFIDQYTATHQIIDDGRYLAFSGCTTLQSIYLHGSYIVSYDPEKMMFYSCSFLEHGHLYVPSSLYSAYTVASRQWINYMSINRIFSF